MDGVTEVVTVDSGHKAPQHSQHVQHPQLPASFTTPQLAPPLGYGFGPIRPEVRHPSPLRSASVTSESSVHLSSNDAQSPVNSHIYSPGPGWNRIPATYQADTRLRMHQVQLADSGLRPPDHARSRRTSDMDLPTPSSQSHDPSSRHEHSLALPPIRTITSSLNPRIPTFAHPPLQVRPPAHPLDVKRHPYTSTHQNRSSVPPNHSLPTPSPSPTDYIIYGIDRGHIDLDIPDNDDAAAIRHEEPEQGTSPPVPRDERCQRRGSAKCGFGFGLPQFTAEPYYQEDVIVRIPWAWSSVLHPKLLKNPMNLLYFHFFINYTARVLVPHDCPENLFQIVLPRMALANDDLLNLMLAYSAYHRARVLGQVVPQARIDEYTNGIFLNLWNQIQEQKPITDAHLATAIMLASLQIISPESFGATVSWQSHLAAAKQMILKRGGWRTMQKEDKVSYFLRIWLLYLDVVGRLSGARHERILTYDDLPILSEETTLETDIDCMTGFTTECLMILAKVGDLCSRCDKERIRAGTILTTWRPTAAVVAAAKDLSSHLQAKRTIRFRCCIYHVGTSPHVSAQEAIELTAINDAFHWAGLIHLYSRALGKHSDEGEIQLAVREIVTTMGKIGVNTAAENGFIFPLFTAGCHTKEKVVQDKILARLMRIELKGLSQVNNIRQRLEHVWRTGAAWETLLNGDFCG